MSRGKDVYFEKVDDESAEALLENGVVVLKRVIPIDILGGVVEAYHGSRTHDIPRRAAGTLMKYAGLKDTSLYRRTRVSNVATDPIHPKWYMRAARPVFDRTVALNDQFFEFPGILSRYGKRRSNWALFGLRDNGIAFDEHQDSQGATGLSLAPQMHSTQWRIHHYVPEKLKTGTPIDYEFPTEPGDVVVITERKGPCPSEVPFREGEKIYKVDGSPIHSGLHLSGGERYGLSLFHVEVHETIK